MKLQQLRYFSEVARQGLSISKAAAALHTSQPGVSKQLALLEAELGVSVFTRNRNRVSALTPAGRALLSVAQAMSASSCARPTARPTGPCSAIFACRTIRSGASVDQKEC